MAHFFKMKLYSGFGDIVDDSTVPFGLVAAANTNSTVVKDSPGVLVSIHAINVAAALRYLKFYNTPKAPVAGSGVPFRRFAIPTVATTGTGFVLTPTVPMRFTAGISFTLVTGSADSDTGVLTAGDVILNLEYI